MIPEGQPERVVRVTTTDEIPGSATVTKVTYRRAPLSLHDIIDLSAKMRKPLRPANEQDKGAKR